MKDKIWIDLTDLSVWNGHLTGIQRVVYNVAKNFHEKDKANFFVFDERSQRFFEFDFSSFSPTGSISTLNPENQNSRKKRLISFAKQSYYHSPAFLQERISPNQLKSFAKASYKVYKNLKGLISTSNPRNKSTNTPVQFQAGDKILILGNSWDRPQLLKTLGNIKNTKAIKIYQVVYDLIPVFLPQAFNEELFNSYSKNMFEVATISDGLLAISHNSKVDMQRFCSELKINCPPITVIRLGDEIISADSVKPPLGFDEKTKFVLSVGTIEARKNHMLLYYVWKEGLLQGIEMPHLVIVGKKGWYTDDTIHVFKNDPQMRKKVSLFDNISDPELVWLYQNCLFTVFPSYYEGWGLPVSESLAMGKVCLTTNISSLPEIGGDLLDYLSPFDSGAWLRRVVSLLEKEKLAEAEKKLKNYKLTSWEETYNQVEKFIFEN